MNTKEQDFKKLVGMEVHEAKKILEETGIVLRVIAKGEENFVFTADYCENRLNVKVDDNYVIDVVEGIG